MVFEKAIFIFHVTFFNVTWKMKLLLHCYTFRKKISNNIFFGPILMELHFLFMNEIIVNGWEKILENITSGYGYHE